MIHNDKHLFDKKTSPSLSRIKSEEFRAIFCPVKSTDKVKILLNTDIWVKMNSKSWKNKW